jgi:hypothetical protein
MNASRGFHHRGCYISLRAGISMEVFHGSLQYEQHIVSDQELLILYAQCHFDCEEYASAEQLLATFDASVLDDVRQQHELSAAVADLMCRRTRQNQQSQLHFHRALSLVRFFSQLSHTPVPFRLRWMRVRSSGQSGYCERKRLRHFAPAVMQMCAVFSPSLSG